MKPIIGITSDFRTTDPEPTYFLRARYVRAIAAAGGLPLILPPTATAADQRHLLDRIDGLLVTGSGPDLDPRLYRERQRQPFPRMAPERARFELQIIRRAFAAARPILGICGGLQVLNVAFGGSLIQDIPAEVTAALRHRPAAPTDEPMHPVRLVPGSLLQRIFQRGVLRVNSHHHQAPRRIGRGGVVSAVAPDGVIEALEWPAAAFVVGVQWHPEQLAARAGLQRRLFRSFVQAALWHRRALRGTGDVPQRRRSPSPP